MFRKENEELLKQWGFEPDKPISTMTAVQLFELIKFTINNSK